MKILTALDQHRPNPEMLPQLIIALKEPTYSVEILRLVQLFTWDHTLGMIE